MEVAEVLPDAIAWRRHLHAHPELSFQEHQTAAFVRDRLDELDGLALSSPTPTSVVATLSGGRPGPTLAMRADLDALPIQEESGVEFASQVGGVMHACGHDGHTAMLLATARLLGARRQELPGEVRFVFQHAEELPPGGAIEIVRSGALDGVDAVVGCHLMSDMAVGTVAALDDACTAAADVFSIRILGRGGHAAFPQLAVDPIAAAAQSVSSLQHVVAREAPPLESVVVSVTRISGGTADNIIPESVELGGTVRTYSEELRQQTREAMERVVAGVTTAHRAAYEFEYVEGYSSVVNDPSLTALVRDVAGARLVDRPPLMAGEDFSAYLSVAPACFFFVGAGGDGAFPHHHPRFTVDEDALSVGIETLTTTALRFLGVQ
ncbi:MAG: amidohydrolase [Solirubrobacterales bacterium]|nr:amidohydrolase [Solirubrobacterales bacterium]